MAPDSPAVAAGVLVERGRLPLWTPSYGLLLTSVFLAYCGQQVILPILPLYVTGLGGTPLTAGLVLAAFSVASFPMRPLVGYINDAWSARGVLIVGTGILSATAFGLFVPIVGLLAAVNAVRGLGWAGLNTAGYTLLTRVAPARRRGEASGYYNLITSLPVAMAPAVGLWVVGNDALGFGAVFLLAAACGASGFGVAWILRWAGAGLDGARGPRSPFSARSALLGSIDRGVFLPTGLLLCMTVTQVAASAFLPLYARHIEVGGIEGYFVLYGAATIGSQLLAARLLDRGARGGWIVAGFALMAVSMLVLFAARSLEVILFAGVVNAVGATLLNTILLVVAMDLANPERPGAGMATYSMSYQMGAALGAPIFGLVIQALGFGAMYLGSALALAFGIVATLARWSALSRSNAAGTGVSA